MNICEKSFYRKHTGTKPQRPSVSPSLFHIHHRHLLLLLIHSGLPVPGRGCVGGQYSDVAVCKSRAVPVSRLPPDKSQRDADLLAPRGPHTGCAVPTRRAAPTVRCRSHCSTWTTHRLCRAYIHSSTNCNHVRQKKYQHRHT